MNQLIKINVVIFLLVLTTINSGFGAMADLNIVHTEYQSIKDADGEVKIQIDWFARPGEMALTVNYNGYLTQEGMVNMYLSVNGEQREFITMKKEMKNRAQKIRIISFHPVVSQDGVNKLATIPDDSIVDSLLFRNAPYYKQFGALEIEVKFFCHSRWDGDGNNNNENFRFCFLSPIDGQAKCHF